jgi:hypothetical protein
VFFYDRTHASPVPAAAIWPGGKKKNGSTSPASKKKQQHGSYARIGEPVPTRLETQEINRASRCIEEQYVPGEHQQLSRVPTTIDKTRLLLLSIPTMLTPPYAMVYAPPT